MTRPKGAPAIIAYSRPFRLVYKDENEKWEPTLDQINHGEYDYVKLHRLSASFDIGLPSSLCLHIGFNGALILPALPEFNPIERSLERLNLFMGELLLGGIYYEAIDPSELDRGIVYKTGYFRAAGSSHGLNAQLQATLQTKVASPIHAISLLNPDFITAQEIHKAKRKGSLIAATITNLSPELILRGVSAFVGRAWAEALSNFWISIEQIVSFLWEKEIVSGKGNPEIPVQGRKEFLKDTRTWTTSTKLELLFQIRVVDGTTYALLSKARKARNALVHQGTLPGRLDAEAAFDGAFRLISGVCYSSVDELSGLAKQYKEMDPITRLSLSASKKPIPTEKMDGIWLGPLPPIPGESEWGNREYEMVYPATEKEKDAAEGVKD